MIAATIVVISILLALLFTAAFLLLPAFRAQIEKPKHDFQQQLQQFELHNGERSNVAQQRTNDLARKERHSDAR